LRKTLRHLLERALPALVILVLTPGLAKAQAVQDPSHAADSTAALGAPALPASAASMFRADRLQHASLAFASGLAIGVLSDRPEAAAGAAVSLGVLKEFFDDRFDPLDLVADVVGAGLAAIVTFALDR
jgi:hypothetical protein